MKPLSLSHMAFKSSIYYIRLFQIHLNIIIVHSAFLLVLILQFFFTGLYTKHKINTTTPAVLHSKTVPLAIKYHSVTVEPVIL